MRQGLQGDNVSTTEDTVSVPSETVIQLSANGRVLADCGSMGGDFGLVISGIFLGVIITLLLRRI